MSIFDRIDPLDLDRRELYLRMLALTVILVLAIGLALMMYPTVFSEPLVLAGPSLPKFFFSFCALSLLLIGHLIDRHMEISHLRKQLAEEEQLIARIRREASADLLNTLPGFNHFRDRLAMEHRRASHMGLTFSLLVVKLKPSAAVRDTQEVSTAFGDAAKAMIYKLRPEDSLYHFAAGVFGLVLPGVTTNNACSILDRLADGLQDASGASTRFMFDIRILNYPEHAATAREMENAVRACLPKQDEIPNPVLSLAHEAPGSQL
jgi:GGDEF domain-containing protein